MYKVWLLFDPRRALVAPVRVPVHAGAADPLHPAQHGSVQLARGPPGEDRPDRADDPVGAAVVLRLIGGEGAFAKSRGRAPDALARGREVKLRNPFQEGPTMAMLSFERKYRVRGGTLIGGDLFDFWVGPFYVGFFGVTTDHIRGARNRADHLWRGASGRPGISGRSASLRPTSNTVSALAPLKEGGLWQIDHGMRARSHSFLGAARSRDLPQARHGLSRPVCVQRGDLRLRFAGRDPARS